MRRSPNSSSSAALALLLYAVLPRVLGQDHPVKTWNITGECTTIVLPQMAALHLLPELTGIEKFDNAYATLQGMVEAGKAKLASTLIVKIQSGEKGEAASVEEMRYATEFDPPEVPDGSATTTQEDKNPSIIGITPTAFETRNIGAFLELEASTSNGQLISVKATPSHVRFVRWAKTEVGKLPNGKLLDIEVPIFHEMKSTSSMVLRNGQRVLVGIGKLPEPLEGVELCFLEVHVSPAPEK